MAQKNLCASKAMPALQEHEMGSEEGAEMTHAISVLRDELRLLEKQCKEFESKSSATQDGMDYANRASEISEKIEQMKQAIKTLEKKQ